jgi:hypothetical protein
MVSRASIITRERAPVGSIAAAAKGETGRARDVLAIAINYRPNKRELEPREA